MARGAATGPAEGAAESAAEGEEEGDALAPGVQVMLQGVRQEGPDPGASTYFHSVFVVFQVWARTFGIAHRIAFRTQIALRSEWSEEPNIRKRVARLTRFFFLWLATEASTV